MLMVLIVHLHFCTEPKNKFSKQHALTWCSLGDLSTSIKNKLMNKTSDRKGPVDSQMGMQEYRLIKIVCVCVCVCVCVWLLKWEGIKN